jgi:hypothetical protein
VPHSKVRSSNPRSPGEIRASAILCLQVGHIGRSTIGLRIAFHQNQMIFAFQLFGLSSVRLVDRNFKPGVFPASGLRNPDWSSAGVHPAKDTYFAAAFDPRRPVADANALICGRAAHSSD